MKTNKTKGSRCVSWNLQETIGIFETMRAYGGKIFRLEEHLDRLEESAKTVGIQLPKDREIIANELRDAMDSRLRGNDTNKNIFIRITISKDNFFITMGDRKLDPRLYRTGVRLRTSPVKRSLSNASPPEAKTSDYTNALMATLEPSPRDIFEWVFLDKNGYVTEVRLGNLFVVLTEPTQPTRFREPRRLGRLVTPPTPGILNGVTRRVVLECARDLKIPVSERPLTRHEIFNASETFLTNTSWEILPICELDGRRIRHPIPGLVTKKLHEQFKRKVQSECRSSRSVVP